jgi:hypothetical protein
MRGHPSMGEAPRGTHMLWHMLHHCHKAGLQVGALCMQAGCTWGGLLQEAGRGSDEGQQGRRKGGSRGGMPTEGGPCQPTAMRFRLQLIMHCIPMGGTLRSQRVAGLLQNLLVRAGGGRILRYWLEDMLVSLQPGRGSVCEPSQGNNAASGGCAHGLCFGGAAAVHPFCHSLLGTDGRGGRHCC